MNLRRNNPNRALAGPSVGKFRLLEFVAQKPVLTTLALLALGIAIAVVACNSQPAPTAGNTPQPQATQASVPVNPPWVGTCEYFLNVRLTRSWAQRPSSSGTPARIA